MGCLALHSRDNSFSIEANSVNNALIPTYLRYRHLIRLLCYTPGPFQQTSGLANKSKQLQRPTVRYSRKPRGVKNVLQSTATTYKSTMTRQAVPQGHMAPSPPTQALGSRLLPAGAAPGYRNKMQSRAWQCSLALVGPFLATLLAILERCFRRTPPPSQPYGWALKVLFSFFSSSVDMHLAGPEPWAGSFEEERCGPVVSEGNLCRAGCRT